MNLMSGRFRSFMRISKMSSTILKVVVATMLLAASVYVVKHAFSRTFWIRTRAFSQGIQTTWQCELNRRLLQELQREIREKDNLLKYRGKIITSLRSEVVRLNATVIALNTSLCNLTELNSFTASLETRVKESPMTQIMRDKLEGDLFQKNKLILQTATQAPAKTVFPPNLPHKAEECLRPCCIALKRMTDILKEYVQTERDLRERIDAYEKKNITEEMIQYANAEKWRIATLNCTEKFQRALVKNVDDKYAMFQTFVRNTFYETATVYRADPSQKFASKFHRNADFRAALQAAIRKAAQVNKVPERDLILSDGLVKSDEINGMVYDFCFILNKSRTFTVSLVKPFGPYLSSGPVTETTNKQSELINVIVPISAYTERFQEFLRSIKAAITAHENIFITVVVYGPDPANEVKAAIKSFSKRYNFQKYDVLKRNKVFNRAHALHDGIMRWNGHSDVLLFLCDVDVRFDISFLHRCRRHSRKNLSVYMPVVFSLYNPERVYGPGISYSNMTFINITKDTGVWRAFGYGMVCTYRPDYLKVGGLNLKIKGWGGEDVDLYKRFYKSNMTIIRAPDPGLFHIWHPKFCDPKLKKSQFEDCLGSKARYEASQRQLGILLMQKDGL